MSSSHRTIEEAFTLHQKGQLAQAKAICEHLLAAEPHHADALHLLGVIACQTNNPQHAAQLINQAIQIDANRPAFYCNFGNVLQELNRWEEAVENYNRAIAIKPDFADAYFNRGNALQVLKQLNAAIESYNRAIAINPAFTFAYSNRGNVLQELNRLEEAVESYDRAIALQPHFADAYFNRGNTLHALNRLDEAIESYSAAIRIEPRYVDAYFKRGNGLQELKYFEKAVEDYDCAISIYPDYADAFVNRGLALSELKQFEKAVDSYDRAIAINPHFAEAHFNRGNALKELKQLEAAILSYDHAISIHPNSADTYFNRGNTLKELKQWEAAVQSYERAIALNPHFINAYINRGGALEELEQLEAAMESYECVIKINPDYADAYFNRGNILLKRKQLALALESYDHAIALKPDFADAYSNRGNALQELNRYDDALKSYDDAIKINPDYATAYVNRGLVLLKLMRTEDAIDSYNCAIAIKPDLADAHVGRGAALVECSQLEAAVASYEMAMTIKPNFEYLFGALLHTKMKLCDWTDLSENAVELCKRIERNEKSSSAFPLVALTTSLSVQRKVCEIFANDKYPTNRMLGDIPKIKRSEKIRVGYFSADFHFHAISTLLAELFECHDKNHFELIAFSLRSDIKDPMRDRIEKSFDQFIDVSHHSDEAVALLARQMNIMIAIDLGGATAHARTGIFAYRAAPIQVNYLGWPGTMGTDYFDYLIADQIIVPREFQQYYTEKIVYLPNSYQANDTTRPIADKMFSRAELGLPEVGFIFCCFNNSYKFTPTLFDSWMRILKATPESVLFLYAENKTVAKNLRKEAIHRGVDADRLVFGERLELSDYLVRYKIADLFLNTFPYNAGTTASDALWVGLPVLTLSGETFVSRVTASLLNAIGLPELITVTQEDYEAVAIALATNPTTLNTIKAKLAANRLTTPLFNTTLFTKHLENAYLQMSERYHADLLPDHLYVVE